MAFVRKRRVSASYFGEIRDFVGRIFSSGDFYPEEYTMSEDIEAQLSITGEVIGLRNAGCFDENTLYAVLKETPHINIGTESGLKKLIAGRRFTVMCGDNDRSLAIAATVEELIKLGFCRILIATDTVTERDNIAASIPLMFRGVDGVSVSVYKRNDSERYADECEECIDDFLTAESASILIIGRDSFARKNNILRRKIYNCSLAEQVAESRPVVLTSTKTVESGQTISDIGEIFSPAATVIFAGEAKNLRDDVIFDPVCEKSQRAGKGDNDDPDQLAF